MKVKQLPDWIGEVYTNNNSMSNDMSSMMRVRTVAAILVLPKVLEILLEKLFVVRLEREI
jgi:hypothetical protein